MKFMTLKNWNRSKHFWFYWKSGYCQKAFSSLWNAFDKFKDNRKDNMVINIKNFYGIGNILKICLFKLKQAKEFKI